MDVSITINTEDVLNDVYIVSGHTGKALENIDKVSATEDESNLLEPFFVEAASELSDVISSYGTLSYGSDSSLTITFQLPANWKQTAKPSLEKALHNYLVNSVCQRWFAVTNREDVKYYADKVVVNATNIVKLLCERIRPTR